MQYCFYLLFNILVTAGLLYAFYDPKKDYALANSTSVCMDDQSSNKAFCAQCVFREENVLKGKGYIVQNDDVASILKIRDNYEQLKCNDYLQLPKYEKVGSLYGQPQFESIKAIQELTTLIGGALSVGLKSDEIISPEFDGFVIYRWFGSTQEKSSVVKFPSLTQVAAIQHVFLYVVNGTILLFIGLYLYNKESFSHLKPKNLIIASIYLVLFQVLTLGISSNQLILSSIRIIFFAMLLARIDTNAFMNVTFQLIGIIAVFFPFLYFPYVSFVFIALLVKGMSNQNTKEIWLYSTFSILIYMANLLWWNYEFAQIADSHCRLIELGCLTLTPMGLLLIRDAKYVGFDLYKPNEPKKHAISLSGFEEVEEDDEI